MKKKNLLTTFLTLTTGVLLVGCTNPTPKEEFTKAFNQLDAAKQYELTSTLKIDIEEYSATEAFDTQVLEVLKNSKLIVGVKGDEDKAELNIQAKISQAAMTFDFNIPVIFDKKTENVYIPADVIEQLPLPGLDILKETKGKYINISSEDIDSLTKEEQANIELLEKSSKELVKKYINLLDEGSFDKNDTGEITLNIKPDLVVSFVTEANKLVSNYGVVSEKQTIPEAELEEVLKEFKIKIKVENDTLEKLNYKVGLTNEGHKVNIFADTEINSLNKEIKFKHNVSENNVISIEELRELIGY